MNFAKDWTQAASLAVNHSNHYTRMFSVFVGDCKLIIIYTWLIISNSSNSSNYIVFFFSFSEKVEEESFPVRFI